jgi:hypothetical protein
VKDLRGVGFGEFERIPIDQVDLLSADLRKAATRVGEQADQAGFATKINPPLPSDNFARPPR